MIRVLHVIHWFDRGGIETWLLDVLSRIDRREFQFDICLKGRYPGPVPEMADKAQSAGARLYHCPQAPWDLGAGFRMRRILSEGRYDIIHSHLADLSHVAVSVGRELGIPARITHDHSARLTAANWANENLLAYKARRAYYSHCRQICLECSTEFWYVSEANRKFKHTESQIPSRVVYLGVPVDRFSDSSHREETRRALNMAQDVITIGHVGRMAPQKNHEVLVRAFKELADGAKCMLVLVGDGPLRSKIARDIGQSEAGENALFLGARSDVPRLLHAMDVFAFPSLHEGLPTVLLEAQAAGLPVVASDIPENLEATPPAVHKYFTPPTDHLLLSRRLSQLASSCSLRTEIASRCREFVSRRFDRGRCLDNMLSLYRTALNDR